ncbi:GtrA family protein [Rosenbergiella epipactidis]|nr:GtrA family protein [Rosenbergiella epipactidis]
MDSSFIKYIIVGLANTALTVAIIFILTSLGLNLYISNALGYVAGIVLSFLLNSLFTFNSAMTIHKLMKFLTVCAISYLVNLVVMKTVLTFSPGSIYLSQLAGIFSYTVTGYLLNKKWAMK